MLSSSAVRPAFYSSRQALKIVAPLLAINLFIFMSMVVLQGRVVWLVAALVLAAFAGVTLLWPEIGTTVVLFTIYSNIAVALLRFHYQDIGGSAGMDTDSRSALLALVGLALIVPMLHYIWHQRQPVIIDLPFALICLYGVALSLSAIFSLDTSLAAQKILRFICEGVILYFLVINVVREQRTLRKAMWTLVVAASLIAALSVFQEATGTQDNIYWGLAQRGGVFGIGTNGEEIITRTRAAGSIGEQNRYAQILLVVLPLAAFFFRYGKTRMQQWGALVACGLILSGIVLTFSRGAFVALVILLLMMGFMRFIKWSQLGIAVLALSTYVVVREPDYLVRISSMGRLHTLIDSKARPIADPAATERLAGNIASLHVFAEHPIIGVGSGVYAKYYATPEVNRLGVRQVRNFPSHNLYLNIAAESGILGLGLFMAIVVTIAMKLRHQFKARVSLDPELRELAACFLLGLCAYLLSGMFAHLAYERYFWLQLALCSAAIRVISQSQLNNDIRVIEGYGVPA